MRSPAVYLRLVGTVEACMKEFHQAAASITHAEPMDHVWRPFALAYATGRLAKKWKLIPADWGSFKKATLNAYRIASECMEEGLILESGVSSRRRPSKPCSAKCSCQSIIPHRRWAALHSAFPRQIWAR